jgi:hypothetical protein
MAPGIDISDLDYAFEFIKRICLDIGPGSPCSAQEAARAAAVKTELEKTADEVRTERFVCAPDAFLKWFQFASTLAAIAARFY